MRKLIPPAMRLAALGAAVLLTSPGFAAEPDWSQVGQALGKSGGVQCPAASTAWACRAPT